MTKIRQLIFLAAIGTFMMSCDQFEANPKYDPPDWLAGKLYTQLLEQPDLSSFAQCLELTGYDTIINKSGSYSVFAPNNEAFSLFFQDNPLYGSVEDIPIKELTRLVKFHIVQNPWSKSQLRSLDVFGWIDTLDIENDEPRGFKRETLLSDENIKMGVKYIDDLASFVSRLIIVDTLESSWYRRVISDSRKYTPFFYKEYFDIYDLDMYDYEFYFGRQIEDPDDIYIANGRIIGDEIFAENGFVYEIDRVVEPLQNARQLLISQDGDYSYGSFYDLVNQFPQFIYNESETFDQPGAEEGLQVDSLFELSYPVLAFDINNERTEAPPGMYNIPRDATTIRFHHGIIAPTDQAFSTFINAYLVGPGRWGSLKDAPEHIRRIIANTHMSVYPVYPTDFTKGIFNGENDYIYLDEGSIIQQEFASNCTFIGVSDAIVPRAFSSVTGPVYLLRNYSKVMYAIERTGLLPALKKDKQDYMFFVESDMNTSTDSSLMYNRTTGEFSNFFRSGAEIRKNILGTGDLRTLLLNHVGTSNPKGFARKEFIRNLAGNYIIIERDDLNGVVTARGTAGTTDGYRGSPAVNIPAVISENTDNGTTYDVGDWFSFTAPSLFITIDNNFDDFHQLLRKAGLTNDNLYEYTFISSSEYYTVLVPSSQALTNAGLDTLSNMEELKEILMLHFIQGGFIFTDGNMPPGYYETARIDEKSTNFSTVFTEIYIEPDIDVINIPNKQGNNYTSINESGSTNIMVGRNLATGTVIFEDVINTGVIHQIDTVLFISELERR